MAQALKKEEEGIQTHFEQMYEDENLSMILNVVNLWAWWEEQRHEKKTVNISKY